MMGLPNIYIQEVSTQTLSGLKSLRITAKNFCLFQGCPLECLSDSVGEV